MAATNLGALLIAAALLAKTDIFGDLLPGAQPDCPPGKEWDDGLKQCIPKQFGL